MGTIRSEDGEVVDTKLAIEIMELIQKRGVPPNEMILILLTILYEYARVNDIPPEEAAEHYKAMFLSLQRDSIQ
jgi:hypothetical protein